MVVFAPYDLKPWRVMLLICIEAVGSDTIQESNETRPIASREEQLLLMKRSLLCCSAIRRSDLKHFLGREDAEIFF